MGAVRPGNERHAGARPWRRAAQRALTHALLIAIAAAMAAPFAWMALAGMKPLAEFERFNPLPMDWRPEQYLAVLTHKDIAFGRYFFNSLFAAAWVTFLTCLTSAMAAFAFARLEWPGRDRIFQAYVATMMVPGIVLIIPNFAMMVRWQWLDSYLGLIVPASFSAFGAFLLRQFMIGLPRSLDEAAAIDGAGPWRIFWDLALPLSRPSLIVLAVFTFMGNYVSFYWPLIVIKSEHLRTLPIGMLFLDTAYGRQTNLILAASTLSVLPMIALFMLVQKYLVQGIQLGAVKG